MDTILSVLEQAHHKGRRQIATISPSPHLLCAYQLRTTHNEQTLSQERRRPMSVSKPMWKLRCVMDLPRLKMKPIQPITPVVTPPKRSVRLVLTAPVPSQKEQDLGRLLKGIPPHPSTSWSKAELIDALVTLAPTRKSKQFIKKVISLGNSPYKHPSAIYKMFNKWKSNNLEPGE